MRIGDLNSGPVEPPDPGRHPDRAPGDSTPPAAQPPEDDVQLSHLSDALANAGADPARLEKLRLEVQAGTYKVPASEIAKKIVDFHTE